MSKYWAVPPSNVLRTLLHGREAPKTIESAEELIDEDLSITMH